MVFKGKLNGNINLAVFSTYIGDPLHSTVIILDLVFLLIMSEVKGAIYYFPDFVSFADLNIKQMSPHQERLNKWKVREMAKAHRTLIPYGSDSICKHVQIY